jgi:exopolysaccharide biosynthesis polyprenyl glycosylphosphotransferase
LAAIDREIGLAGAGRLAPRSKQSIRILLYAEFFAVDLVALLAGPLLVQLVFRSLGLPQADYMPSMAIVPIYMLMAINNNAYSVDALGRAMESFRRSLGSYAKALLLTLLVAYMLRSAEEMSRLIFIISAITTTGLLIVGRGLMQYHVREATRGGLINQLMIVDGRPLGAAHSGSCVVIEAHRARLRPDLNDPQMLDRFGRLAASFDRILIDSVPERHRDWALLLKGADVDGEILLEQTNQIGAIGMRSFHGAETLLVSRKPLSLADRMRKRMLDLALTVPLLIAIGPLLAIVAIAVKFDSPGPVLFKQDRVGRGNRLFKVLKFRSMRVETSDASGSRSASRDDDRITKVGRFIRATSIDELPQLLNVLLGDMSLVGPRPHALGSLAGNQLFWQVDETYWHRHQLKPGITGLAQVRGFRGATALASDLTNRLQSDMEYIQDWDIWRDIGILANTFRVLVHRNAF